MRLMPFKFNRKVNFLRTMLEIIRDLNFSDYQTAARFAQIQERVDDLSPVALLRLGELLALESIIEYPTRGLGYCRLTSKGLRYLAMLSNEKASEKLPTLIKDLVEKIETEVWK